jgi:NADPH-dependent 2,4-dienoyl-CoA reductase/sulfur reductase-like enzyme
VWSKRRGAFSSGDRILIVGTGAAGLAAGEELRRLGFAGEVVMLGGEPDAPYDRPACSKALLNGHARPQDVKLPIPPGLNLNWYLGRRAIDLDPIARRVTADSGEVFDYDGLVIATGGRAVLPKSFPEGAPHLHPLYTVDHAWAIRHELRDATRVAIVGGGLTGCEVACTVTQLAREAVLIDSKMHVMDRAVGEAAGTLITDDHLKHGIEMRLGRRVSSVEQRKGLWRLQLDDGSYVNADLVVVTAGERPDTAWLDNSGLDNSDGVLCDESLRVVGGENIVAAGVAARWPNLRYSEKPVRAGQWIAAIEQGQAAAYALLAGDEAEVPPFTVLPRFWSQQNGLRLQVCGQIGGPNTELELSELRPRRKDTAAAGVVASYYERGRLTGVVAVNAPHAFTSVTRAMLAVPPELVRSEATSNVTSIRRYAAVS